MPLRFPPQQKYIETRLNKGIITSVDPADIDPAALSSAKNVRVRFDKTSRRFGNSLVAGSGAHVSPIQTILQYRKDDGTKYLVAIHSDGSVQYETGGVWTIAAGLTGAGVNAHYQATTIKNRFVVSGDGSQKLRELVIGTNTFADLSANAPLAKFVTGFFNRIVAANQPATSPVELSWSADGIITEFDPSVEETAGTTPLADSPSDLGDAIMGVMGMDNLLFIPREFSLWLATKQPIPTQPFYAYSAVSGIGTNAPYSVARILKGAAFADTRTATAWLFDMGSMPEPIGRMVEKSIFKNLADPALMVGSYNATTSEYSLLVPSGIAGVSRIWVFNFLTKAWSYDEIEDVNTIADLQYVPTGAGFDDLLDTIDSQVGTMDSLGLSTVAANEVRLLGMTNGAVLQEDETVDTDNGTQFTCEIVSKDFSFPQVDQDHVETRFEYQATKAGLVTLSYSKDAGNTWKVGKTFNLQIGQILICRFQKNIKSRRFKWKLESPTGLFDILSYEVYVSPSGISTK